MTQAVEFVLLVYTAVKLFEITSGLQGWFILNQEIDTSARPNMTSQETK